MADNKQNSETENKQSSGENKTATGSGAASTQPAKESNSAANKPAGSQSTTSGSASGAGSSSGTSYTTGSGSTSAASSTTGTSTSGTGSSGGASATSGNSGSQSGNVTDTAKDTLNQVKDSAGTVATEAIGQVKDKASTVLGEQKTNLASGVASVADTIRQVGENLGNESGNNQVAALAGKYGENLASQIEKFSSYVDEKEIRELVRDVEQFARRNPLMFVGGAFALGIFAARFLKSSGRKQNAGRRSRN
jgi:ElaB/YqjD/DUF883 family membrane-anchored ribosome-binding protein